MKIILSLLIISNFLLSQQNLFADYQRILNTYVDRFGRVNYKALSENEVSKLAVLLRIVKSNSPLDQSDLYKDDNEKLAYWMNAYNLIVLNEVATHYPISSIQNVPNVWKKKHKFGKASISLDEIEHNYIKSFSEPRTHFAIICAAYSCPKLQTFVFKGDQLEKQFQKVCKDFYANKINFQIVAEKNMVKVSELFFWYTEDFTKENMERGQLNDKQRKEIIRAYLLDNASDQVKEFIQNNENVVIERMPWHWQLNEASL